MSDSAESEPLRKPHPVSGKPKLGSGGVPASPVGARAVRKADRPSKPSTDEDYAGAYAGNIWLWAGGALLIVVCSFLGAVVPAIFAQAKPPDTAQPEPGQTKPRDAQGDSARPSLEKVEASLEAQKKDLQLLRKHLETLLAREAQPIKVGIDPILAEKVSDAAAERAAAQVYSQTDKALQARLKELYTSVKKDSDRLGAEVTQSIHKQHREWWHDEKKEVLRPLQEDLATVRSSQAKSFGNVATKLGELGAGQTAIATRLTAVEDQLGAAKREQEKRLASFQSQLDRLRQAMGLPAEDKLAQVLFILECGAGMQERQHESARKAVIEAIDSAIRQTPNRLVGLFRSAGEEPVQLLNMEKHYFSDIVELYKHVNQLVPLGSKEINWQKACEAGVNRLATLQSGRRRLVYVTCGPAPGGLRSAELTATAVRHRVEVWVVQLVKGEVDAPARELSHLATATGGQFVTVAAERGEAAAGARLARRLSMILAQSLDLRQVHDDKAD